LATRERIRIIQTGTKHGPCPIERRQKISESEKRTKHREPTEEELLKQANRKLYGKHLIYINNGKIQTRIYPNA